MKVRLQGTPSRFLPGFSSHDASWQHPAPTLDLASRVSVGPLARDHPRPACIHIALKHDQSEPPRVRQESKTVIDFAEVITDVAAAT